MEAGSGAGYDRLQRSLPYSRYSSSHWEPRRICRYTVVALLAVAFTVFIFRCYAHTSESTSVLSGSETQRWTLPPPCENQLAPQQTMPGYSKFADNNTSTAHTLSTGDKGDADNVRDDFRSTPVKGAKECSKQGLNTGADLKKRDAVKKVSACMCRHAELTVE